MRIGDRHTVYKPKPQNKDYVLNCSKDPKCENCPYNCINVKNKDRFR